MSETHAVLEKKPKFINNSPFEFIKERCIVLFICLQFHKTLVTSCSRLTYSSYKQSFLLFFIFSVLK